ncbi:MAG TPA: nicotinate-nucleotide--dimethylbenzimidazole phosphoribosyltransferase [Ktedonobacteraceae bacterium]|jgi:NaMN:DMB phosphoribosyltransferase|nr:nicotinate-nucleotide--dimethylbenzimidazole phosphoribosyltransferase [Ktedonobacteraceae bacterium]
MLLFAGHVSVEQRHRLILTKLGLSPLLDLQLRLGEGAGAALAMSIIEAALRMHREMATFAEVGVYFPTNVYQDSFLQVFFYLAPSDKHRWHISRASMIACS